MAFAKSAKRGLALLGSAAMMVGFAAPTLAAEVQAADASTNTYYVQVDQNLLGTIKGSSNYGVIYGPTKVTAAQVQTATGVAPADQTVLDVLKTACGADNVISGSWGASGSFLTGFNKAGLNKPASISQAEYINAGFATTSNVGVMFSNVNPGDDDALSTAEYAGTGGWMFTVNNASAPSVSPYYYSVDDKVADTSKGYGDEAVIRFEYSLSGGADIGISDSYVPQSLNADGSFNWNDTAVISKDIVQRVDLTQSIRDTANAQ